MGVNGLKVVFTSIAERDIEGIVDYTLSEWGVVQAQDYIDSLEARIGALSENPSVGIPRPNLAKEVLSFPIDKHVVYYAYDQQEFVVLRVLHQSMDPVRHL